MVSGETIAPATVIILAGDPIIGRTLEILFKTADYDTRYVADFPLEQRADQDGLLDDGGVLLLGPRWDAAERLIAAQLRDQARNPDAIAILEIGAPPDNVAVDPKRYVPWPCGAEELKRRIDAAMSRDGTPGGVERGEAT